MSRLDDLIEHHPIPTWRSAAWPIMFLLGTLIVWAQYAELDEVSIATGEVVPRGNVKVIQHLEGGIIEKINVTEGDTVKAGSVLVQLDLASSGINREELQVQLDSQLLVRARLQAEAEGQDLVLPEVVAQRLPAQALAEERAYQARKRQLEAKVNVNQGIVRQRELDVAELMAQRKSLEDRKRELSSPAGSLRQQKRQKELEVNGLISDRQTAQSNLKLALERLKMSSDLVAQGLVPKMEHLQLEAEVKSLEGQIESTSQSIARARAAVNEVDGVLKEEIERIDSDLANLAPSLPRAQAAIDEAKDRLREEEIRFRREAEEELGKTEQSIARVRELLTKATEQKIRADVRSPIDGVVKNLRYNTIGGVVQPGEAIMEVVPTGDNLVVEAKLSPTDRGYVKEGDRTLIKISTYDYARYGGLDGVVTLVAPDTSTDEDGNPYFRVLVEPDKPYLGQHEGDLAILPGMEATVDIYTGSRTVASFIIQPVLKLRHEAFRER